MNAAPIPQLRIACSPSGELLLSQTGYSAKLQAELLKLPRRTWTGSEWVVPVSDLELVRKMQTAGIRFQVERSAAKLLAVAAKQEARELISRVDPLARAVARKEIDPSAPITDYEFKTKPFEHQKAGFLLARRKREFAFLMEMGTGKTKTAIDTISYHIKRGAIDVLLIVCPLAVLWNWERELEVHSPLPPEKRKVAIIYADSSTEKMERFEAAVATGCNVFITNFATLLHKPFVEAMQRLTTRRRVAALIDESTGIKNPQSKTAKALYKIAVATHARYILTGSPIANNPLDAFGQFRFLDWRILGHSSFTSFKQEYAIYLQKGPLRGRKVVEWKNLDRLREKIAPYSFRVLKKDCLDLPEKQYSTIELPMGPKQRAAYESMRDESIASLEGVPDVAAPMIVTKLLRLSQIAAGYLPILNAEGKMVDAKWFADEPKIGATVELVETAVEEGQKVIIWCRGVPELERLERELSKFGVVTYYGDVPGSDRQRRVDAFQKDPATRVFIGQAQTGGMAITLTAATNVIYYSNSYSLFDRLQSEDRAHRIGQKSTVTYRDLVCLSSIDRLVLRTLREKKDLADVVTGDNIRRLLKD